MGGSKKLKRNWRMSGRVHSQIFEIHLKGKKEKGKKIGVLNKLLRKSFFQTPQIYRIRRYVSGTVAALVWIVKASVAIRFVIDREECFSQDVQDEGDTVLVSFVVIIKAEAPWHYGDSGVDLPIRGPSGEQIHRSYQKSSEKHEFVANKRGLYSFCFTNKSPYHETIDFGLQIGHFAYYDQHAKDEHFSPLMDQIAKLEDALYSVQFEQCWLEAQTDRQAMANEGMSRRAVQKSMFESVALIVASILQIYLLPTPV